MDCVNLDLDGVLLRLRFVFLKKMDVNSLLDCDLWCCVCLIFFMCVYEVEKKHFYLFNLWRLEDYISY